MAVKYDEKVITDIFWEGDRLLTKQRYNEAIEKFLKVIELAENTSYPYISGAYTNLAKATFESGDPEELDQSEIEIALNYIRKALQIKPSNQSAKSLAIPLLVLQREFSSAIEYFLELTVDKLINHSIYYLKWMEQPAMRGEESIKKAVPAIEKLYQKYKQKNPTFGKLMADAYLAVGKTLKTYETYQEMLHNFSGVPLVYLATCINYSLFCCGPLKNPKEAKRIVEEGITIYRNQTASFQNQNEHLYELLKSNLGMVYVSLHEYEEAVKILEPMVTVNPRNTNLHNIAYAFYRLGDFEKALKYCNKALYISKDDLSLFVKAEILYSKQLYEEALIHYKKSMAFIDDGNNNLEFVDGNNDSVFSFSWDQDQGRRKIYVGTINCYIALNDYLSAKAFVQLGLQEWPYEDELIRMDKNIDALMEHRSAQEDIQTKMETLLNELKELKDTHKNEMNEVREWASKLLKLQSRCTKKEEIILESEEDWRAILRQMHEVALAMKEANKNPDLDYNKIKENFKKEFPKLNSDSLEFLSTGEYLYQIHQEGEIDFAPVMVEYSKVIETELNQLLKTHKLIKRNQSLTLGQIKYHLQKVKMGVLPNIDEFLDELITYRNGSAHTGKSTKIKVRYIRDMILNAGWLKLILT
ncbi:tetratricopeptide repeat protein [Neobacillus terrae]|uniref:tetratricopeptide repeat protein n=1 Tax=Neobacillus terrae TaxID=3034837 RepID=UPI00140CA9AF|nr:tetratricopeptide repeat protein [Neobacillus terrae]NHM34062.1 tetratricopeptide repeat protein [Neobacillus terrae]